jgi:hypothetical protein
MSLEAALDEERREVMALLEGRKTHQSRLRASSPSGATHSPVRSMLDVLDAPAPQTARHASIAGQGVGITSPPPSAPAIRSMLDPHSPPPPKPKVPATRINAPPKINLEKEYNFEMLGNNESNALPKRVTQGGKSQPKGGIFASHEYTRSEGSKALHGKSQKSHSPSFFGRTNSPKPSRKLNTNTSSLMIGPNAFVTDGGQVIDMSNAYRRLSDANLLKSGSGLASLPLRKGSDPTRGETLSPDGGVRLTKDYSIDDEEALDTSDGESDSSDEEWTGESSRGRGRTREDDEDEESKDGQTSKNKRQPKSLLAAAEAESMHWLPLITLRNFVLTRPRKVTHCKPEDCFSPGSHYNWY